MPYFISNKQTDCSEWATVKQETDGSYTTLACHNTKQEAIDQMIAVSISEDMEPGGEVNSRSKMKKIERRTFTVRDVEARQAADGTMRLAGYAAVFDDPSVPLPFVERIAPGAFRKTLSETPDVRLLINHEGLPLARTKNGTLTLTEDSRGLYMDAEIADTTEGRDLYKLVERGDVDQMSFAFRVIRQKWSEDRSTRTLIELSLADGDVSIVTYPAYPTTTVEARETLMRAIETIKEGRALDGESMIVVQAVLDKISDSYDSLEEGKTMLEVVLGLDTLTPTVEVEKPEVELMPTDMPATAGRSISLRLAKAIVNNTK
jgi:HK97 family phage prohead protease